MNNQHGASSVLNDLSQPNSLTFARQTPHLARNRHLETFYECTDDITDEFGLLEYERPVLALLGDALWTPQINVHRIAMRLHVLRRRQQGLRVVAAELHYQRAVESVWSKERRTVAFILHEHLTVQHRRITQLRIVFTGQHAEWELGLVYHGSHYKFRGTNAAVEVVGIRDTIHYFLFLHLLYILFAIIFL